MKKLWMKKGLKNIFYNFFPYIKMVNKYYQKHKERLQKEARERYKNFFEEEKDKTQKKVEKNVKTLLKKQKKKRPQYF